MECTLARIGDEYRDQLAESGHYARPDDLERFAALGIAALRYPLLWEAVAPNGLARADWRLADDGLQRLRRLDVRPIAGLVHHGSGPRSTSLLDPSFAPGLAAFARATAERYPWVDAYTPVNEPLTTARFSALYGHWYPHARDDFSFVRALVNQCRAVVLAMREVRAVNPQAQLVQTDDLGKTFSTPRLAYQAEFENERRWLTWDILCGKVDESHPLWWWLHSHVGFPAAELLWFAENPCPPDVVGINHYLSSERFLDERLGRYPPDARGRNGTDEYADVLAARVLRAGPAGPATLLQEAWERYGLPLAVTELHNGSTREEQLRWVREVWDGASALIADGIPVSAVTAWSLLGAFDWHCMLTRNEGHYEPGVFDIGAGRPRPTALAPMFAALASRGEYDHPVLDTPGWWRRDERLWYPPVDVPGHERAAPRRVSPARRLLIVGARGTLGQAFARECVARGLEHITLLRSDVELSDPDSVAGALDTARPWAVVNAAGYVRVDDAESDRAACFRDNAVAPGVLAAACAERGIALATFSSDLVFDGALPRPYVETDTARPLGAYGAAKLEGERLVLAAHDGALVVRTSAFFGPHDPYNFVSVALRSLAAGDPFVAASDQTVSPTYVPELVDATLDLLIDGERGVWHLANSGAVTWAELALRAAALAGGDESLVEPRTTAELALRAPRPPFSVLSSERGQLLGTLDDALDRYFAEIPAGLSARAPGDRREDNDL